MAATPRTERVAVTCPPFPSTPTPRFTAVLTRPAGQSDALMAQLQAAGIDTIDFPLIDIGPVGEGDACAMLDAALQSIDRFSLVFFVSPNAIAQAFRRAATLGVPLAARLAHAPNDWRPPVAVVGPGSVQALLAHGVSPDTHCIVAPYGAMDAQTIDAPGTDAQTRALASAIRYDSEALIAALDAQWPRSTWAGKRVLIVRGDGGRELFADAMREAQADVQAVAAYRRSVPAPDAQTWQKIEALLDAAAEPPAHAWVLSSSEGVRNLISLARARFAVDAEAGTDVKAGVDIEADISNRRYRALLASPVIVPHARIAAAASAAGFDTITNPGAGDMNIVHAVRAASERMKKSKGNYPA